MAPLSDPTFFGQNCKEIIISIYYDVCASLVCVCALVHLFLFINGSSQFVAAIGIVKAHLKIFDRIVLE